MSLLGGLVTETGWSTKSSRPAQWLGNWDSGSVDLKPARWPGNTETTATMSLEPAQWLES